jgi:ADP-ribose pyrophosphatase
MARAADNGNSGRIVFRTKWFDVEEIRSESEPYYRLTGQDAAVVFALTEQRNVLLVRQFRPARGHETLELPAGAIEAGESPNDAALRELLEETGYEPAELHALGSGGLRLDRDTITVYTFAAFGARKVPGRENSDCGEALTLPLADFLALVERGEFEQLGALAAVLQTFLRFPDRFESDIRRATDKRDRT